MYSRIAKNARLGDGSLRKEKSCRNADVTFVSTDKEVLAFKKKLCDEEGLRHSDFGTQLSGYGGTKTIWNFRIRVDERLTIVHDLPIEDLINALDEIDIYMWLIDDGSWHIKQNLFHLYCNMLNDYETDLLINRVEKLFGVKPTMRKDRKKDGRSFNYLYFPRRLTAIIRPKFKAFLVAHELNSMMYKVGGSDYEYHLEKLSDTVLASDTYFTISKVCATARRYDKDILIDEEPDKVTIQWTNKNAITKTRTILKEAV